MKRVLSILLAHILILTIAVQARAASLTYVEDDIGVMSFNVLTTSTQPLTATNPDGFTRGEMFIDMLEDYRPDSIGLNEVTSIWADYLASDVVTHTWPDGVSYEIAGKCSDNGIDLRSGSNEYSPILYRSDKYTLLQEGGYWLSETPDVKSKYGDIKDTNGNILYAGMRYERVFSYAILAEKQTAQPSYIHINLHYDHQSSDYINELCSRQLVAKADELARQYNCPVIITGDTNATEESRGYAYLADEKNGYVNSKYMTDDYSILPSCAGYGENYNRSAVEVIDHIFVSNGSVGVYKHDVLENPYISDHSCIYAKLSLGAPPTLSGISVNQEEIAHFEAFKYGYFYNGTADNAVVTVNHAAGISVTAQLHAGAELSGTLENSLQTTFQLTLEQGENELILFAKNSQGVCTTYRLTLHNDYGDAQPIISEIFPNARTGYRYFEITNVGTAGFSTADYTFLWGNITDVSSIAWESAIELPERRIAPGQTIVVWFTYGGSFSGTPQVSDFNQEYGTSLSEQDIIITTDKFYGFLDGNPIAEFTMGANRSRGMRIAKRFDESNSAYSWSRKNTNSSFDGPSISVSSYKDISESDITSSQLFKFAYQQDEASTRVSEILPASQATPGVYETRLGNESRDAFATIEAEDLNAWSILSKESVNIGNTKNGAWAYYSNVDFGAGAQSATFRAAVKGSNAGGSIDIYIDGTIEGSLSFATKVGTCTVTATDPDNWGVYSEFICSLNQVVTGRHNVILKFNTVKTYTCNLDSYIFEAHVPGYETKDAYSIIEAENTPACAAEIMKKASYLGDTRSNTWAFYPNIDFGNEHGAGTVTFYASARSDRASGIIEVYTDAGADGSLVDAVKVADCTIAGTNPSNWNDYQNFTIDLDDTLLGRHSLLLRFIPDAGMTYVANIDYFVFTQNEPHYEPVDAFSNIQAENAIQCDPVLSVKAKTLENTKANTWAWYPNIDFGNDGASDVSFFASVKGENAGGVIELYIDADASGEYINASLVGTCKTSATHPSGWSVYEIFECSLDQPVTGNHNLLLRFVPDSGKTYVCNLDYFFFANNHLAEPEPTPDPEVEVELWQTGTDYAVGDQARCDDMVFECILAHKSHEGWRPSEATYAIWQVIAEKDESNILEWTYGVLLNKGDLVMYEGTLYRVTYAHTSQSGWHPGAVWFFEEA
ncbi:carbohydrate-binding protein [Ruminococcaceae bacterium OttesenSCG-928-L11]|nr:carbohydrate-binding protein [Ruminococcaceae bacterium OttesenSCG-928-L11]